MANKTQGIINGAMAFDEKKLQPQYKLIVGKPGSSYTFSIAERIGMDKRLIQKARDLVDEEHFQLDKLLNRTEQDLHKVQQKEKELQHLLKENERLKKEMQQVMDREKHQQQVELLKQQNKIQQKEKKTQHLHKENERHKKEMQQIKKNKKHQQQVELLKQQNKIS